MKSFFDPAAKAEIESRLANLKPETRPLWGKMNSAQMLAHSANVLEYACGDYPGKQMFIGKLLMPFMKSNFWNDKPHSRNSPTSPKFLVPDERNFQKEKERFLAVLNRFQSGGPENVTKYPSMFYGKLTPEQWAMGMYKHTDHHFQQFGI